MPALSFRQLEAELRAAGAAPAIIDRTISELRDHRMDAEAAALESGLSAAEARRIANECLGSADSIVAAVTARPALLDWRHRWPTSARYVDSAAFCLALPAVPFVYCATHPAAIVRWGLSSGIAACITASLLLGLQSLFV